MIPSDEKNSNPPKQADVVTVSIAPSVNTQADTVSQQKAAEVRYLGPPVKEPPVAVQVDTTHETVPTGGGTTASGGGSAVNTGGGTPASGEGSAVTTGNDPITTHTYLGPPVTEEDPIQVVNEYAAPQEGTVVSSSTTTKELPATVPVKAASISPWLIIIGIGIGLYMLTTKRK